MTFPQNILFVTDGLEEDPSALVHALGMALANQARLQAVVACPGLPESMREYENFYEQGLLQHFGTQLEAALARLAVPADAISVEVELETGKPLALRLVSRTLERGHDLLVKTAEATPQGRGFKALDMVLVRKCSCPVWLHRPTGKPHEEVKVGVAIDPESFEASGHELSLRLLRAGRRIADGYDGTLHVISCWDYPFETYLRHNTWFSLPSSQLSGIVTAAQTRHGAALEELVKESGIAGPMRTHHLRGEPARLIPACVEENGIDLLVMGSLGRSGIAGLLIGNTSEDLLHELPCSVVTLKPSGFVSPLAQ